MEYRFKILGVPYVKKSNQKVIYHRGLRRRIKIDTSNYDQWHKQGVLQMLQHAVPKEPIEKPVNLCCRFFVPNNGRRDLSNMYEGIQDLLVEMKVLADDSWQIVAGHDGSGVEIDRENPRIEVTITPKEANDVK